MERRANGKTQRIQAALAITMTLVVCGVLVYLLYRADANALRDLLLIVVGGVMTNWNSLINYFTGSTSTSEQKNSLLARSTPTPDSPVTVTTTNDAGTTTSTTQPTPAPVQSGTVVSYLDGVALVQTDKGETLEVKGLTQLGHIVTFRDGAIETSEAPPVVQPTAPPSTP